MFKDYAILVSTWLQYSTLVPFLVFHGFDIWGKSYSGIS